MLISGKSVKHCASATPELSPLQARESLRDQARQAEQAVIGVTMASMDELTLLSNRHGFTTLAQLGLDACQRLHVPATLLLIDFDNLKQISHLYGGGEGDDALKSFADVLRIAFRESDVVGRLGDNEFAALLTGSSVVELSAIRARLEEILGERTTTMRRGYDIHFSIEQIEFDRVQHRSVEGLLEYAAS